MSPRRACCCSSCSCSKVSGGGCNTSHVTRHTSHVTHHTSHLLTHIPPCEHPSTLMRAHYIVERSSRTAPAAARQNASATSHTTTHEASHTTTCNFTHHHTSRNTITCRHTSTQAFNLLASLLHVRAMCMRASHTCSLHKSKIVTKY